MGMTLRELIYGEQFCQGIVGDRKLKGFAPSGPTGGFLPAKLTTTAGLPRDHTNNKSWQALARRRGFDPNATELDILDLELELNLFRALESDAGARRGTDRLRRRSRHGGAGGQFARVFPQRILRQMRAVPIGLAENGLVRRKLARWKNQSSALEERVVAADRRDGSRHRARVDLRTRPFRAGAVAHCD